MSSPARGEKGKNLETPTHGGKEDRTAAQTSPPPEDVQAQGTPRQGQGRQGKGPRACQDPPYQPVVERARPGEVSRVLTDDSPTPAVGLAAYPTNRRRERF